MNNAADQPYFANNRQYRQAPPPPSAILLQKLSNGMNNMQQMAGGLSANAPEFVPQQKFGAAPMNGNFNSHTHQQAQQQQQFQQPQHYNRQPQQQTHHHQQQQQQQQQPQHHFGNDFRNLPNLMNTLSVQQHLQQQQPQSNQQQQALVQQQQQQQHHFHHNHHNHNVNNRNQNHYRGKGGGMSGNSVQNRLHRPHQQQHSHQHHNVNNHHHQHQPQQQQQQQPHHHHQDSSHGATTNGTPDGGEGGGSGGGESAHSEQELLAIGFIETVIQELSDDPGTYDNISRKVLNIYEDYQNNEFVLSNVMEIVFKRSIEEQNFRYMGAKLYGLFDLLAPNQKSLFRSLLSFKLDYHQTEMLDFLQNDQVKVRGTALFLAELYMQLRNDGTRLKIVAESIVLTIKQLLNKSTPENIKCICMTLKLAGYDLEFDYPQDMQFIMTTLEEKVDTLDVSTSRVLENVLQLQKQKWGRKTESSQVNGMGSSSSSPMHKFDLRASDEPVFYGPDGQVLSEEESSFLTSHMMDGYDGDLNAFDESPYPFAEMDEETEKAFEDFLKMSRK